MRRVTVEPAEPVQTVDHEPALGGVVARVGRVVETEWVNYRRTWKGTVWSAFLAPLLYLGAIGFGLGSLVETEGAGLGTSGSGEALGYVAFLAPGLVAATAMQVGSGEAIFGTMARIKWAGNTSFVYSSLYSTLKLPGS